MKASFLLPTNRFHAGACILFVLVGGLQAVLAQEFTAPGNAIIQGELDVHGNTFNLGSWVNDNTQLGLATVYAEDTDHAATLTFTANRPVSNWLWQELAPTAPGKVLQMSLSSNNALTLYDKATSQSPAIILDPVGGNTSFKNSVTINGTSNLMPFQTLSGGANSVLTMGLADARYFTPSTGSRLILGAGASTSGDNSVALGYAANAAGAGSTLLGSNTTTNGYGATAIGWSANAYANGTTALGFTSSATGNWANALGYGSVASNNFTTAVGSMSTATGPESVAFGTYSQSNGQQSVAVGAYAQASGDVSVAFGDFSYATGSHATALGEYTFATNTYTTAVGNFVTASGYLASAFGSGSQATGYQATALGMQSGVTGSAATAVGFNSAATGAGSAALGSFSSASGAYATALTSSSAASGDYSVAAGRTTATSLYQTSVGAYGQPGGDAHNWVATDDLFTVGNGTLTTPQNAFSVKKNGDTEVQGNLKVDKALIVLPQGDLQMGEFVAQPSPSPTL